MSWGLTPSPRGSSARSLRLVGQALLLDRASREEVGSFDAELAGNVFFGGFGKGVEATDFPDIDEA